jgi:cobalt-zinc-cadmium efflux system membrane fusion protein
MLDAKKLRFAAIALLLLVPFYQGCKRGTVPPASAAPPASPADAVANHAIETEIVSETSISGAITATGKVSVPEDGTAVIGPVHEGRLVRLYAGQGTVVRKGQKLADLESADIDQAEADYLKAVADLATAQRTGAAEVKLAQATYDRTKMLVERTITARKNLDQADHDLELAKANLGNAVASAKLTVANTRRHLIVLGLKDADIDGLAGKPTTASVFSLTSPISGVVVERNATLGATVGPDANVFKIIDIARVWVDANVFERDLERVHLGQQVALTVTAFPESRFTGTVILVSSVVDPETRTVKVRTEVPNPDGRLKPDMFANVEIVTDVHRTSISIPLSAVLDDNGKSIVFIADGNGYKKVGVNTGIKSNDRVEIIEGLKAGDRVVVKGNYLLQEQTKPDQ